ncbi:hypothetical protein CEXT_389801 [Caerostris extrusa]|uniref:Uncharacterized protein n=1 Tax=Caerostris extrusa TaxID=172846 RepID=A0AAV4VAA2_CAEEX|nr:hypothetical protein CEXT_389801 [Caerostris extrusa]
MYGFNWKEAPITDDWFLNFMGRRIASLHGRCFRPCHCMAVAFDHVFLSMSSHQLSSSATMRPKEGFAFNTETHQVLQANNHSV